MYRYNRFADRYDRKELNSVGKAYSRRHKGYFSATSGNWPEFDRDDFDMPVDIFANFIEEYRHELPREYLAQARQLQKLAKDLDWVDLDLLEDDIMNLSSDLHDTGDYKLEEPAIFMYVLALSLEELMMGY